MNTAEVVRMKRGLALLLILIMVFSACALTEAEDTPEAPVPAEAEAAEPETVPAEEDDGDDSNPEPVDMMEEEELEEDEEILEGRMLRTGDQGDDVLALQTRLKDLGYYTGKLSSKFDKATQEAVQKFQADYDLEETGVADMRTLSILFSIIHRPLRYGSGGEDVKELQRQLTELGYYKGKISGNFLGATKKAVEELQKKAIR